jgi:predicted nucleotidyltransferase
VTKVDERSVVPPVDAAARERLAAALDRDGVVAAYLVGSQARGDAGPLSDVDVAVWLAPGATPDGLADRAERALATDEVDLIVLDLARRSCSTARCATASACSTATSPSASGWSTAPSSSTWTRSRCAASRAPTWRAGSRRAPLVDPDRVVLRLERLDAFAAAIQVELG